MRFRLIPAAALAAAVGAALLTACSTDPVSAPSSAGADTPLRAATLRTDAARREALARQLALALADSAFRAEIRQSLAASPIVEHKLQFQRFMREERHVRALDRMEVRSLEAVQEEVAAAPSLEFYFPVPGDLERWRGGPELLVATSGSDAEAPVAFDVTGRRLVLDPTTPPRPPVLALVPQETDFDAPSSQPRLLNSFELTNGGSGSPPPTSVPLTPGLYLKRAEYLRDFEGWLKGAPEFEVFVVGRQGATDSLQALSCTGRTAAGPYRYVQDKLTWSGRALIYTTQQLQQYQATYPGQGLRIIAVEDDDGACVLRLNQNSASNTIRQVEALWPQLTGGNLDNLRNIFVKANAGFNLGRTIANFFTTNDDLVGNAIDRSVTGEYAPFGNWIIKGENAVTNGYFELEMVN